MESLEIAQPLYVEVLASASLGGGEVIAIQIAHGLQVAGERVQVWTPGDGPAQTEAQRLGLDVVSIDYTHKSRSTLQRLNSLARLRYHIYRARPNLIHVHSPLVYGAISPVIPKSVCRIAHVHLDESLEAFPWCFKHMPDQIVCCAEFLARKTARAISLEDTRNNRITALPNAVNTEIFSPNVAAMPPDPAKPRVLMMANLAPHKGQVTAIRAIAELKNKHCQPRLLLAGVERESKGFESELRQLVAQLNIQENVEFLGFRRDTASLLQNVDFLLLPSLREGLPICILEAQASGVLVIAAPTAGIPEIIDHMETGMLLSASDFMKYAHAISQLSHAADEYMRITRNAFVQIQSKYTWTGYVQRVRELYSGLLAPKKTA